MLLATATRFETLPLVPSMHSTEIWLVLAMAESSRPLRSPRQARTTRRSESDRRAIRRDMTSWLSSTRYGMGSSPPTACC